MYTDHKPLVPLSNSRNMDIAALRCQSLLLRLGRYNPNGMHKPGKYFVITDTLSRALLKVHGTSGTVPDVVTYVQAVGSNFPMSDPMLCKSRESYR